jgi:hypothetical protein
MRDILEQFPDGIPEDMPLTRMIREYIAKEGGFYGHTTEHPQEEVIALLGGAVIKLEQRLVELERKSKNSA